MNSQDGKIEIKSFQNYKLDIKENLWKFFTQKDKVLYRNYNKPFNIFSLDGLKA